MTPEDIIDVWYGWDEKGNLMALRISDNDADSNPNGVMVSVYPFNEDYAFERYGSGYLNVFEDKEAV